MEQTEIIVVGAGIIGLSLAHELATRGRRVVVIDMNSAGKGASWAAAGILPAVCRNGQEHDDLERLRTFSWNRYAEWTHQVQVESGIDVELDRCGGIHLAATRGELVALGVAAQQWIADGHLVEPMDSLDRWKQHEPRLATSFEEGRIAGGFWLPDEMVVRPPLLLKALLAACRARGVVVEQRVTIHGWDLDDQVVHGISTSVGEWRADQFCLAAGVWTPRLLSLIHI